MNEGFLDTLSETAICIEIKASECQLTGTRWVRLGYLVRNGFEDPARYLVTEPQGGTSVTQTEDRYRFPNRDTDQKKLQ
jgi:hypothetical protein